MSTKQHFVKDDIFYGLRNGNSTAIVEIYYQIKEPIGESGDILLIVSYGAPGVVVMKIKGHRRIRLQNLTDEDICALGYPDLRVGYRRAEIYPGPRDWFSVVWDDLHPFKGTTWKDNPMIIFYDLEKEE